MRPFFSIVILNYNRGSDLVELIYSIKKQQFKNFEIIVVDNNSSDKSEETIKKNFSDICVISLSKNIGRAGHNKGAEHARGEVIIFFDADIFLPYTNFLSKTYEKFSHKNINAVSFYMENPRKGEYGWEPTYLIGGNDKKGYESTFGGGMWAIRRKIFEEIGGFNPNFFVYVDEWEYLIRLWKKRYKVLYFPDLRGMHKESPYSYRSVMKGYHVIINHAQLYALYLPVSVWLRFFRHHIKQSSLILTTGQANRKGTIKGLLLATTFFLKALPHRNVITHSVLKKFLLFYFPEKGKVVVGKWGWKA